MKRKFLLLLSLFQFGSLTLANEEKGTPLDIQSKFYKLQNLREKDEEEIKNEPSKDSIELAKKQKERKKYNIKTIYVE